MTLTLTFDKFTQGQIFLNISVNPLPPKWRWKRQLKLSPVCQSDVKNVSWEKIILDAP